MPEIEAEHVLRNQILIAAGGVAVAVILFFLAKTVYMLFAGAKNTPIVISGGSITGHTRHKRDWSLPHGTDGTCPSTGSTGPLTCLAVAKAPHALVTSANFTNGAKYLYQQLDDANWKVVVTGTNDNDPNDNPALTIQPADGCNPKAGEACISFSIGNSALAHFGPRHQKIEGLFGIFNPHRGRSICRDGNCGQYRLKTVAVWLANVEVANATCSDSTGCLICLTDNATDAGACALK